MHALQYHKGQLQVQEEANSRSLADHMADWVGPAVEFAERADLLIISSASPAGHLTFEVVSGEPPLVAASGDSTLDINDRLDKLKPGKVGGLAINLGEARRVRLNGTLHETPTGKSLEVDEAFTLCRKYMAPTAAVAFDTEEAVSQAIPLETADPWLSAMLAKAETSFLASITPDGAPDVAHRGGTPGFLTLDPSARTLSWPEYLGDGVFKSAGNVRATSVMSLLVLDLTTGDAAEFAGTGTYTNLRIMAGPRRDPLVRDRNAFPVQGRIVMNVAKRQQTATVSAAAQASPEGDAGNLTVQR